MGKETNNSNNNRGQSTQSNVNAKRPSTFVRDSGGNARKPEHTKRPPGNN